MINIDFYSCDKCGEVVPNVIDYGYCSSCDSVLCVTCKDEIQDKKFDEDGELSECPCCNKPVLNKEKFSTLMYFLTKDAAKYSFVEFLQEIGVTEEEYDEIKRYLKENYNTRTYI